MEKRNSLKLIGRFLPYFKKYKWILVTDLFMASLTTVCELVLPLIVREITDRATTDLSALTVDFILKIGLFYIVLRLIDTGAQFYMNSVGHIMGTAMETDMRSAMFGHLQKLSFSYYDNAKVGTIMSRITTDLFEITEFAHHCPEEFFIAGIKIIAGFVILSSFNLWLTVIIFAILPLMLVCTRWFNQKMRQVFRERRVQTGELNAQVEDSLLGVRVVKSFAGEPMEKEKFEKGNSIFYKIKKTSYYYMAGFHSTTRFFDGLMYIAVVVAGACFLRQGAITIADFTAYLMFVTTLLTSVRRIVEFTEQFQQGITGIERFFEILDAPVDIEDAPDARELTHVAGDIELKDVSFRYGEEGEETLSHLNLHIKSGENVALVGPSGGGKTTLCNLIPRFYEIQDGNILVDGGDIRNYTLSSLRRNIGMVQQDVYLFSGTVKENILYGRPDATDEEIIEAAKLAGAHEFIMGLTEGYHTYVGERGVKLSGGQKQRISIARVFLKNPPILILDEATSALDNESERLVQQSLERLAKGRTTLTIAHRLTTIQNADRILVLTEDGIVEEGTHEELLAKKGIYHSFYQMYSAD